MRLSDHSLLRTLAVVFLLLGCASHDAAGPSSGRRVLFIGNSLTEVNDLPAVFGALASASGTPAEIESVLRAGYGLPEQWDDGAAQLRISSGHWDFVVLQQGPSALPESRAILITYAARYDTLIRAAGGRTVMYAVWPDSTRRSAFDSVSASYRAAAQEVGGLFAPVGDAWLAAWRRDASIALYGSDGFHPTPEATYLAALVLYATIFDRTPIALPTSLTVGGQTRQYAHAMVLQQAAAEVTSH